MLRDWFRSRLYTSSPRHRRAAYVWGARTRAGGANTHALLSLCLRKTMSQLTRSPQFTETAGPGFYDPANCVMMGSMHTGLEDRFYH